LAETRIFRRFPDVPPVRDIADIDQVGVCEERALHLPTATVVYLDRAALTRDFPELESVGAEGCAEWILQRAALATERQVTQDFVNTPIVTVGTSVIVHRPPQYGRSIITTVAGGLLDIKGAGVAPDRTPAPALHQNGLMQLGEALQELAYQTLIDAIFFHTDEHFTTLPVYAVIAPGFDVRAANGQRAPAGMLVRRAHRRPPGGIGLPTADSFDEAIRLEIELLLRRYGVTSCNNGTLLEISTPHGATILRYGEHPPQKLSDLLAMEQYVIRDLTGYYDDRAVARFEYINVQLLREIGREPSRATVVDFGHYRIQQRFDIPLISAARGRVLRWGRAITPTDSDYVQPDDRLAIARDEWEGLRCWSLAQDFCQRRISRADVETRIRSLVAGIASKWE
jgi:hypothetical protein